MGGRAYLDSEEEKVEVEVKTAENVFVGRGHENRTTTVGQDSNDRAVQLRGLGSCRHPWGRSGSKGPISFLLAELDCVVFVLLVVRHGCGERSRYDGVWTRTRRQEDKVGEKKMVMGYSCLQRSGAAASLSHLTLAPCCFEPLSAKLL